MSSILIIIRSNDWCLDIQSHNIITNAVDIIFDYQGLQTDKEVPTLPQIVFHNINKMSKQVLSGKLWSSPHSFLLFWFPAGLR